MKTEKNPIELLICDCHSTDHQIILLHEYDEETDENGNITKKWPMCYVHIHLNNYHTFWQRIKYGIKYIFGYKCRYGAFDEFIFNPEDAPKLQKLVDHLNEQIILEKREV
jgi:hypothetical protein